MTESERQDDGRDSTGPFDALRDAWQELTSPGAPFEVETVEVFGQRIRAYANAPASLREVWSKSAEHADKDAFVFGSERWTYSEAQAAIAAVANWLFDRGLRPGDRIALAMRNYPEWMFAYWAAVSSGLTVSGLNAWSTGPELEFAVADSTPRVMICDDERLERWRPHHARFPGLSLVSVRAVAPLPDGITPWSELLARGGDLPDVVVDPDSDACIFYTSGTTGKPKGAQLSHRGCTNNLMSIAFWSAAHAAVQARLGSARAAAAQITLSQPALLVTTPLFHVTANNCIAQNAPMTGSKLVLMHKWEAGEALRLIERERITSMSGVPTIARELLAHPDFAQHDTTSLVTLSGGGAAVPPDLVRSIDRHSSALPRTGYGMTETCGIITANIGAFFLAKPDSVGPVMPCFEARCVDEAGRDVAPGEVGELWVRGAQVIRGYLNRPEATAAEIPDGWLHTGDLVRIDDDGFVFVIDRAKDMVLRGGENVYCAEIEAVLYAVPGVRECAVFAVPDERLGEEVGAAVVVTNAARVTADELRSRCAAELAGYKIPRYLWLREDSLPRNANGKVLKRQLREELDPEAAQ